MKTTARHWTAHPISHSPYRTLYSRCRTTMWSPFVAIRIQSISSMAVWINLRFSNAKWIEWANTTEWRNRLELIDLRLGSRFRRVGRTLSEFHRANSELGIGSKESQSIHGSTININLQRSDYYHLVIALILMYIQLDKLCLTIFR